MMRDVLLCCCVWLVELHFEMLMPPSQLNQENGLL